MQIQLSSCHSKLSSLEVYHANILEVWSNILDEVFMYGIRMNVIVSILCSFKLHHKPMSESSLPSIISMSFQEVGLRVCYYLSALRTIVSTAYG